MNDGSARRFRTQLGGYHKDDVNQYIKETDLRHEEELADAKKTAEDAQRELSDALEKIAALEAEAESRAAELEEKAAACEAAQTKLSECRMAFDNEEAAHATLREEFDALSRNAESLAQSLSHLREESSPQKKRRMSSENPSTTRNPRARRCGPTLQPLRRARTNPPRSSLL